MGPESETRCLCFSLTPFSLCLGSPGCQEVTQLWRTIVVLWNWSLNAEHCQHSVGDHQASLSSGQSHASFQKLIRDTIPLKGTETFHVLFSICPQCDTQGLITMRGCACEIRGIPELHLWGWHLTGFEMQKLGRSRR